MDAVTLKIVSDGEGLEHRFFTAASLLLSSLLLYFKDSERWGGARAQVLYYCFTNALLLL